MKLKKSLILLAACYTIGFLSVTAQTKQNYHTWAPTPPLGWNRKGLISEKGVKKRAFFVLQKYYKKK